jgi:sirohydrochlorin cobaltochelatase
MRDVTAALAAWLAAGARQIGQVAIRANAGGFTLCHIDDLACTDLAPHARPEDARTLATFDDAGNFRPLKTAPNLRHGWRLEVRDATALRRALDYLYPAMCGVLHSAEREELIPIPLRETLARQSGMYAVTRKITDSQAAETIARVCGGCLKTRLWTIGASTHDHPASGAALPMLCHEACNLLIAEARRMVKAEAR